MTTSNITNALANFTAKTEDSFKKIINKEGERCNKEFQSIISQFIDNLNSRYKRHCFIFCDAMGMKSIDCYHRVTKERIWAWTGDENFNCNPSSTIKVLSISRSISDTKLSDEITKFMFQMQLYENSVTCSYYFLWNGKVKFDHVLDSICK